MSLLGHRPRNASYFGELGADALLLGLGWGKDFEEALARTPQEAGG